MKKNFNSIINEIENNNFHEKNNKINYPDNLFDLPNLIIYGPENSGKYYHAISIINKYYKLNTIKKLEININKENYYFYNSEIHYEIDFSLLGTSAKNLWYNFFNQVSDILLSKKEKVTIILIKNFHNIHEDLLCTFYNFLQNNNKHINIKFMLLTQQYSFIPDSIKNRCVLIKCKKPSIKNTENNDNYLNNFIYYNNHIEDTNKLIIFIINFKENYLYVKKDKENMFKNLRENIYNILIKNYNIYNVITHIIFSFLEMDIINNEELLIQDYYNFIKYYNNNYRPIYHIEKFIFCLIDNLKN